MDSEIQQYAGDILAHPRFQQLRTFCHHGLDNSVYDHSVAVAEAACLMSIYTKYNFSINLMFILCIKFTNR